MVHKVYGLMQGDLPASGKVGRPTKEDAGKDRLPTNKRDANYYLAALKKKRPDLAQQVIDGGISATKAAREAEAWNLELFTICKKR